MEQGVIGRRVVIDQPASCGVDEDCARSHRFELGGAHELPGRGFERKVQRHDVGTLQHILERDPLHRWWNLLVLDERIVDENVHAERGNRAANA